ncbi:MAG: hypothetical protein Q8L37_04010 [Candidatus Gottesmanbacteria bacterium]|nr:hypothetical protein [Candidatus Gottesmanbacteria bacterium]
MLGESEAHINPSSISTDWENVHDKFFVDDQKGDLLTPTQVISLVRHNATHYVGLTPSGFEVFSVMPEKPRTRFGQPVSLEVQLAMQHAQRIEFLSAIRGAEDSGLITREAAVRQAGGASPDAALLAEANDWDLTKLRNAKLRQTGPNSSAGTLFTSDAPTEANGGLGPLFGIGLAAGLMAETGIPIKTPKKDSLGRRFKKIKAFRWGVNGVVASSLVLSACTPISSVQPVRVENPAKIDNRATSFKDLVNASTKPWYSVAFGSEQYQFDRPVQFLTQEGVDELVVLRPVSSDASFNSSDRWAVGQAVFLGKDKSTRSVPFFVRCDAQGNPCEGYALVTDEASSTVGKKVFQLGEARNGKIVIGKWSMVFDGESLWLVDKELGKSTQLTDSGSGASKTPDGFRTMMGNILLSAFKLAEQQVSPTKPAVPTVTPTFAPTSTPEARNWVLNPPVNFAECCAINSEYATRLAKEKFDAINTPSLQEKIKKIKADPAYQKPSFNLQPTLDPLGKDIPYQYTAYYQMAIYAGGHDVTLPKMDWSIGKSVDIKVKMHVYIPIEKPNTYIITIGRITDTIGSTDSVLGTRDFHKNATLPNGQPFWEAQVGKEPTPGQMFQIFLATGMGLVDVNDASKTSSQYNPSFAYQGKFLEDNIGMKGANSIGKQILALSDQDARRALMKTLYDSQKFHLLVRARLYE